ncbi:uncharacterized protein PODANS_3_110 [Podospora anserina S mat+]|uniref:Podospora anserina S mat+ genomic DNA chromosome 3, supercontig 1 n=1 Tax=Podospora anserina (strain S / ATCC MYA-4624 / DSM 980 / FGSC 10383) TaxID=515849 RepID=B2AC74_PODAN|nr:uncharacterized protein PODANS_3_110 [Podospora anserina S mat+]CAP61039.1 unnamed protein product [Podospora anserina S mat+]CDP26490.1 Putative protein of unknown function [Podospora anserina S mat+]
MHPVVESDAALGAEEPPHPLCVECVHAEIFLSWCQEGKCRRPVVPGVCEHGAHFEADATVASGGVCSMERRRWFGEV